MRAVTQLSALNWQTCPYPDECISHHCISGQMSEQRRKLQLMQDADILLHVSAEQP